MSFLGVSVMKAKETKFFYDVVKETLRQRRELAKSGGPKRNDLVIPIEILVLHRRRMLKKGANFF
jgi:hypothetical protein